MHSECIFNVEDIYSEDKMECQWCAVPNAIYLLIVIHTVIVIAFNRGAK